MTDSFYKYLTSTRKVLWMFGGAFEMGILASIFALMLHYKSNNNNTYLKHVLKLTEFKHSYR